MKIANLVQPRACEFSGVLFHLQGRYPAHPYRQLLGLMWVLPRKINGKSNGHKRRYLILHDAYEQGRIYQNFRIFCQV